MRSLARAFIIHAYKHTCRFKVKKESNILTPQYNTVHTRYKNDLHFVAEAENQKGFVYIKARNVTNLFNIQMKFNPCLKVVQICRDVI